MKNILIFNDISGLGNCSMSANLPVFTKYGLYCMPVPTAVYSMQTGFDGFCVLPNVEAGAFAKKALALRSADAVYVGFCNDTATLSAVGDLLVKRIVQSCNDELFEKEIECIKETYANNLPSNIDFIYYTGDNDKEELVENCLKLTCCDDIYSTFRKTYYALRFLQLNNIQYDYIVRTNTSTYINIKLLNKIINSRLTLGPLGIYNSKY